MMAAYRKKKLAGQARIDSGSGTSQAPRDMDTLGEIMPKPGGR